MNEVIPGIVEQVKLITGIMLSIANVTQEVMIVTPDDSILR